MRRIRKFGLVAATFLAVCVLLAQTAPPPVKMKVEIVNPKAGKKSGPTGAHDASSDASHDASKDASNVVVWLTPVGAGTATPAAPPSPSPMPQIVQINKSFDPHVLVIQVGTEVRFPNKDPFLHNVFSLFDGKRFDLGFYEAGSSKTVHFDRVGVSFLFCNIHPEMSAAVIAVDTPYFGASDRAGRVSIPNVPDGAYQLNAWYERSLPGDLKGLARAVTISNSGRSLETIRVIENPNFSLEHKNKYGQDYVPPANTYGRP